MWSERLGRVYQEKWEERVLGGSLRYEDGLNRDKIRELCRKRKEIRRMTTVKRK